MPSMVDILALSHVPRWAIVPHVGSQSVGDHTFRVLVIFSQLCDEFDASPNMSDVWQVLYHDAMESRTGDIPSPAKQLLGLKPEEYIFSSKNVELAFRLADLIEAWTFITVHGTGYHARRVSSSIYAQIRDTCPAGFLSQVLVLMDDITFDKGR